jgi:uncharacterized protein (TIGR03083 family)
VTSLVPKDRIVQALAAEFTALDALLSQLDDHEWAAPTPLPGWDVKANVAHIVGTESMLAGIANPEVDIDREQRTHVRNDIGAFNEQWVAALAELPPSEVLERFRAITSSRLDALDAMDQEAWDAEAFTPAGRDSYGRFMRIRVFDCWMHEQDIRDAIGMPGHEAGLPVDVALDEMSGALGFLVGKKGGAPQGSAVTFDLDGRKLHVVVEERAKLVESLPGAPTVRLTMSVGTFSRLGGGRIRPDLATVHIDGDQALGQRIVENLAYTV